jgi:hypothetical protein
VRDDDERVTDMASDRAAPDELMSFCRRIEDHLTRVNGGHLVRIVGPGFDLVRQWFTDGIPIGIVTRGIDARVERQDRDHPREARPASGGPRPLRIEFCDADVRSIFNQWRRAVGLTTRASGATPDDTDAATDGEAIAGDATHETERRRPSLGKHLDRAVERLSRATGRLDLPESFREAVSALMAEIAELRDRARGARGPARDEIVANLPTIDRRVLDLARQTATPEIVETARRDAERDLAPYRTRLSTERWASAIGAATDHRLRDLLGLPTVDL